MAINQASTDELKAAANAALMEGSATTITLQVENTRQRSLHSALGNHDVLRDHGHQEASPLNQLRVNRAVAVSIQMGVESLVCGTKLEGVLA